MKENNNLRKGCVNDCKTCPIEKKEIRKQKRLSEKQFEEKVKRFLKDNGIWYVKTWSNGIQRKGIPDIIACVNGYFVGIELKAENGKPSELQLWNIEKIKESGGEAYVLYPDGFETFKLLIKDLLYRPKNF